MYNTEINLRQLIKNHLSKLLHYKNEYWKKRYTVNRVKFGDECTKFFHSVATISFRRNAIPQLKNDQGIVISDHEGKAGLLLSSFRKRMGITSNSVMVFDLDSLVTPVAGLGDLALPFLYEEIDLTVRRVTEPPN